MEFSKGHVEFRTEIQRQTELNSVIAEDVLDIAKETSIQFLQWYDKSVYELNAYYKGQSTDVMYLWKKFIEEVYG